MNNTLLLSAAAAALSVQALAWDYEQVDRVDLDPLETIVAGYKPLGTAKKRVLYFSEYYGYNHKGGRAYGDWTFKRAGEVSGAWELVQEKDPVKFADADFLAGFDAIVFCNSSGFCEAKAPGLTKALSSFVKGGKGVAIIHAGLDAFKDSDELLDLFGGYFRGHPWHGEGTWKFLNEDPANPINASFRDNGATFFKVDEIYQFPAFYNRKDCHVLVSVDLSDPATKAAELWWGKRFGKGSTRHDHDYAVSWTKTAGRGRVFYTSFGHDRTAFLDAQRLYHMFRGLEYALGNAEPPPEKHSPSVAYQRLDWANGPWLVKLNERVKAAQGKELDFAYLGDSITMGWMNRADDRYPGGLEVWEKHWGGLQTLNLGMSGDRIEHLLWRITDGGQVDGWKAKTIFVMIGINNSGCDGADECAEGVKRIVEVLGEKHPESKIVLLGVLPWKVASGCTWEKAFNSRLAALAGGKVVFRDLTPAFLDADGRQKPGFFNDGLHPSPLGYETFADELDKLLK